MTLFGVANAVNAPRAARDRHAGRRLVVLGAMLRLERLRARRRRPARAAAARRASCSALVAGVPIGFVLAFASLLYFLADPTLPMLVYSQQVMAGSDHFVLLGDSVLRAGRPADGEPTACRRG